MVHRNSDEPSAYSKNENNEENNVGPNSGLRSEYSKNEFIFNLKNYNLLIK